MANLVSGVLSQHVRRLVEVEHRKENENVIALHLRQAEKIALVQLLKLKNVMSMDAQVNIIGSCIFSNEAYSEFDSYLP